MTKDEIMRLAAQVWSANGVYIGPSIIAVTERHFFGDAK